MNIQECNPRMLADRKERALAKLARIARNDCVNGGARASVLAERLAEMGAPEYGDVVSAAYTNSQGEARDYLAYECPECGTACLGLDNAARHCAESDEPEDEPEDDESDE